MLHLTPIFDKLKKGLLISINLFVTFLDAKLLYNSLICPYAPLLSPFVRPANGHSVTLVYKIVE